MGLSPVPPADSAILVSVKKDWTWFTQHLLTIALLAVIVLGSVYGVLSLFEKHDAATAAKYELILNQQSAQTKALAAQNQQDEQNWLQAEQTLLAQNAALTAKISARDTATKTQVQQAQTLNAVQSAAAISTSLQASPGEVTPVNDTVVLDLPISRKVNESLIQLASAQQDVGDLTEQLANETQIANNNESDITELKALNASQTLQIADQTKACSAQIAKVKAGARKGKFKWFIIGYVAGFGSAVGVIFGR